MGNDEAKVGQTKIEATDENIKALRDTISAFDIDEDIDELKERVKAFITLMKEGKEVKLTDEDKTVMDKIIKTVVADILDIDKNEIKDDTHLIDDLAMDSLAFLELFDEFKETFRFEIDVNLAAKYAQDHPVETYGEFKNQLFFFIEKPDEVFKELGIEKGDMLDMALNSIDKV